MNLLAAWLLVGLGTANAILALALVVAFKYVGRAEGSATWSTINIHLLTIAKTKPEAPDETK